ncbi:MAG: hypothetical protein JXA54_14375 [Candidatus Heimdallarchaeota archaeon]|nr:hypothetical protein [Candidatus Heimdallarchaeota archaeon]
MPMIKLLVAKKRIFANSFLLSVIFVAQILGNSIYNSNSYAYNINNFSNDNLIGQIKTATSELTSLFNEELGIFIWNVQNPLNLSRYGELSDLSNSDESLQNLDIHQFLDGLAQDILLQYSALKNNIQIALDFIGTIEEESQFNREWIFMTEKIISWLYYQVATNDQLISILNSLSNNKGFEVFWNTLIRSKYNEFLGERIALLPDTLVLGSKILRAVEFMPYFSFFEQYSILLLSEVVSKWWQTINQYALYDPKFAVAGIGEPIIQQESPKFIGWQEITKMTRNDIFSPKNIFTDDFIDFQNSIYTSPQIANEYLTYIRKASAGSSIIWDNDRYISYPITNNVLKSLFNRITTDYGNHISWINNQITYIYEAGPEIGWHPLDERFSGYSYIWDKYFVGKQDSQNDYYQYQYDTSPLKITDMRSFQGAGDIRGLMDVYRVLSQGFVYDSNIQFCEEKAMNIIEQILNAKRSDNTFIFSPYFGTAIMTDKMNNPLINDADLILPDILPDGLKRFTGTMTVMSFLLKAYDHFSKIGAFKDKEKNSYLDNLISKIKNTILDLGKFLLANINPNTLGIPKQSVIAAILLKTGTSQSYITKNIKITINIDSLTFPLSELPNWIFNYNEFSNTGQSYIYQWNYLYLLKDLFVITGNEAFVEPLFKSHELFTLDYLDDKQYQIAAICEGKDAIVRTFFHEDFVINNIELRDYSGLFSNIVPYKYRSDVFPVTNAFALETPQRINGLILSILSYFLEPILDNPINQVVIAGFMLGIIMSVVVVYIKRPKHQ